MTWDQINDWFDAFHEEYVEGKKPVRGVAFSGAKLEIWSRDSIAIVLSHPYLRGNDQNDKAVDFVKSVFGVNHQTLQAEIDYKRFQQIISGEKPLSDEDWIWPDE